MNSAVHTEYLFCLMSHFHYSSTTAALHCQLQGGDPSPLLSTGVATPGVQSPALSFSVQEKQGHAGDNPAKGHVEAEGTGASLQCGKAERA